MRRISFLLLILVSIQAYSQNNRFGSLTVYKTKDRLKNKNFYGYFVKNNIYEAVRSFSRGAKRNSKFCHYQLSPYGKIFKKSPEEISEYGLPDGTVYESHKIFINGIAEKRFLKRIVKGTINLLYLPENDVKFYIRKDKTISAIKNSNIEAQLNLIGEECKLSKKYIPLVKCNKKSLKRFVNYSNKCKSMPYLIDSYTILLGVKYGRPEYITNYSYYISNNSNNKVEFENSLSAFIGIHKSINLSPRNYIQIGINLSRNKYKYSDSIFEREEFSNKEDNIKLFSIELPVIYKYEISNIRCCPEFKIGLCYMHNTGNSNHYLINSIPKSFTGYSTGVAFKYPLNLKQKLLISLDYSSYIDTKHLRNVKDSNKYKSLSLGVGYSF